MAVGTIGDPRPLPGGKPGARVVVPARIMAKVVPSIARPTSPLVSQPPAPAPSGPPVVVASPTALLRAAPALAAAPTATPSPIGTRGRPSISAPLLGGDDPEDGHAHGEDVAAPVSALEAPTASGIDKRILIGGAVAAIVVGVIAWRLAT